MRVIANCNFESYKKGKEYAMAEKVAKKYAEIKMMYMSKPMVTILEEKKVVKKSK